MNLKDIKTVLGENLNLKNQIQLVLHNKIQAVAMLQKLYLVLQIVAIQIFLHQRRHKMPQYQQKMYFKLLVQTIQQFKTQEAQTLLRHLIAQMDLQDILQLQQLLTMDLVSLIQLLYQVLNLLLLEKVTHQKT